ncbi:MAG: hypothetical protein J6Y71_03060 [Ruminococcus sp.]|nr:hypothetical protein [Ruminococcus sp.]
MKRFSILLLAFAVTASLTACGPAALIDEVVEEKTIVSTQEITEQTTADDLPGRFEGRQTCFKTIANSEKPELVKIRFSGECDENIKKHASVSDLYGVDYLHSGVVGLVGSPIDVSYDEQIKQPELSFIYDKEQLRGVPEKNLIVLHYNENDQFYDTIEKFDLDTANCIVSVKLKEDGVYLLADAFQWYGAWGMDVSKYAYDSDPTSYETDWEREWDTGSIMELADKQWAIDNAPNFHVSTPEELASVVYYVNGLNKDGSQVSITLENDIDLTGYDWKPIGWTSSSSHQFSGTVDGKNHNINGMKIAVEYEDCGFIGYGLDVVMRDISFTNADVSSTRCTGIAGGEIYFTTTWTNVRTQGKVSGGTEDYGAIVGRETSITFKNCVSDVTVDGKPFEYLSYRQKRIDDVEIVETFHLTLNSDGSITRDDHDGFRNLSWHIEVDGVQVLERSAVDPKTNEPELTLDKKYQSVERDGKHSIYLVAYINGAYIRVSNIIEFG